MPRIMLLLVSGLLCVPGALGGDRPPAAEIVDVQPAQAARGSVLTISGSGFGKHPRVLLVPEAGGPSRRARLLSGDDGQLKVQVRRSLGGLHAVVVRPRGPAATEASLPAAVDVRAPEDLVAQADCTAPGDTLVCTARWLGHRKGRVRVGGLRAKVLAWEPLAPRASPESGLGQVVVRVPAALSGSLPLELENALGSTEAAAPLWVLDASTPAGGTPGFSGRFGDESFEADVDALAWSAARGLVDVLAPDAERVLECRLLYDVETQGPALLQGLDVQAFTYFSAGEAWVVEFDAGLHSSLVVEIEVNCHGVIAGRFEGRLVQRLTGEQLEVSDGRFQLPWALR